MTTPAVPRQYWGSRYTRERYVEGWQDGRAGKPHAHASHAAAIIRRQGQAQYETYSAGHTAGREAAVAEPGLIAWLNARLGELEQAQPGALDAGQLASLAARLRRTAAHLETSVQAGKPPAQA
jgi:hypothetical protein